MTSLLVMIETNPREDTDDCSVLTLGNTAVNENGFEKELVVEKQTIASTLQHCEL